MMGISTIAEVTNPDEIVVAITIKMNLKHWREFENNLSTHWPNSEVSEAINSVVNQARQHFYPDPKETPAIGDR